MLTVGQGATTCTSHFATTPPPPGAVPGLRRSLLAVASAGQKQIGCEVFAVVF